MKDAQPGASDPGLLFVQMGFGGTGGVSAVCRTLTPRPNQLGLQVTCIWFGTTVELAAGERSSDGLNVAESSHQRGELVAGKQVVGSECSSLPGGYDMPENVPADEDPQTWAQAPSRFLSYVEDANAVIAPQFAIGGGFGPDSFQRQVTDIYSSVLATAAPS